MLRFEGATLNITVNCLDRHAAATPDKPAIFWEGDEPGTSRTLTYAQLLAQVCQTANALLSLGVKKGDRVTIYLPMVPEAAIAMLACARIGAVHSVVFGGFSPDAIRNRIEDCASDIVITANEGRRAGKRVLLKVNIDRAIEGLTIRHVLVLQVTETAVPMTAGRDLWWHHLVESQPTACAPAEMDAEDPLFVLYTSGSTGKPKGLLHTTGGYMVYAATTAKYVFDLQPDDVYWCTADVGWITGHSYLVYGPLLNGATTLMFEGVPTYPDASRFWQVIDRHQVTKFYTAPTAIRALMAMGDAPVKRTSRASLKLLATVGEPINPEAWLWYHNVVGEGRCPVIDTWWQTETGGHMLTPLPGATPLKPGSCGLTFFGVQPEVFGMPLPSSCEPKAAQDLSAFHKDPAPPLHSAQDDERKLIRLEGECEGQLVIADSWPGQARSIWGDHARFIETYFSQVPGKYFTADGCRRDADGHYWITGRVDDVINVSGHRLGTAEIESALVAHPAVAEAAVVGYTHDIKGQGVYAYVTLNAENARATNDPAASDALIADLKQHVRRQIGGLAVPDFIHLTPGLPKTRSGKIMRRILRKIAENEVDSLGDTSTLLNPEVVEQLIEARLNN